MSSYVQDFPKVELEGKASNLGVLDSFVHETSCGVSKGKWRGNFDL